MALQARVVTLLPSATEIVGFIGGSHLLVARSHECDYPPDIRPLPAVTGATNAFESSIQMHNAVTTAMETGAGLYTIDRAAITALAPTMIITQSLCSVCSIDMNVVRSFVKTMPIGTRPDVISLNPFTIQVILGVTLGTW